MVDRTNQRMPAHQLVLLTLNIHENRSQSQQKKDNQYDLVEIVEQIYILFPFSKKPQGMNRFIQIVFKFKKQLLGK